MRAINNVTFSMITRYLRGCFDYIDTVAKIVLLDEYGGGSGRVLTDRRFPIADLAQMCDGGYRYRQKHKRPVSLLDSPQLIVIFSHHPPEEVYCTWVAKAQKYALNETSLAILRARFNVIRIDGDDDVTTVVPTVTV